MAQDRSAGLGGFSGTEVWVARRFPALQPIFRPPVQNTHRYTLRQQSFWPRILPSKHKDGGRGKMAAGPGRLRAAGGERPRARRPGPRLPSARPPGRGGCFPRHRSPARSAHTSGGVVEGAWAAPIPRPGIRPPPQDGSRPLFTRGPRAPGCAPPGRGATSWAPAGRLRGVAGSRPSTRGSSEHRAGAGGQCPSCEPRSAGSREPGATTAISAFPGPAPRPGSGRRAVQRLARMQVCAGRAAPGGRGPQRPGVRAGEGASPAPTSALMKCRLGLPRRLGAPLEMQTPFHWQMQGKQAEFLLATK